MSETPFFSVIVPAYNVEAYIEHTVRSILEQTWTDWECVLVNDGSTDGTGGICQRYALAFPQKILSVSQENRGVSNARNTGMEAAKGRYLVFVDGDDYLAATALEEMQACLQKKTADLLYYDFQKRADPSDACCSGENPGPQREQSRRERKKAKTITPRECILRKLKDKTIPAIAACYSRTMIERDQIRFDEEQSFVEDALFFFTCVKHAADILYYPGVLYYYVQRADSATHKKDLVLQEIQSELKGWTKIKRLLAGDREIHKLLHTRMRKIQRNYRTLCFFRFLRRIIPAASDHAGEPL